ncbi:sulfotransferase family 2 domain-containing protein [Ferdinandcohnia sp. SAFN-114]|uniref:sulfotransferase family 2 domain-containing protein n=1 Tax=Ferdinandcohnia sp. SAFN-114 TaxID=3387275 RepID=UPI003F7D4D59
MKSNDLLIHLHMPKTGGTTLKKILKKNYPKDKSFDVYETQSELDSILKAVASKKPVLIQGHLPFGIHSYFSSNCTYITLLRDPVNRVISEYYFIRSIPWHEQYHMVKNLTLEEFQQLPQKQNIQTHLILGNHRKGPIQNKEIEIAKEILKNHFAVVGITEMFNESLFLMAKKFGWKNTHYKKANITKNKPSIEQIAFTTIEAIRENNQMDIEIYEYGKQLLFDEIQALSILEKKQMKLLGKNNPAM